MITLLFIRSITAAHHLSNLRLVQKNSDLFQIKDNTRHTFIRMFDYLGSKTALSDKQWINVSSLFPQINFITVYCDENKEICSHFQHSALNQFYCLIRPGETKLLKNL